MFRSVDNQVDFIAQENEVLKFWDEIQAFKKLIALRSDGPRWSFIDGPITANNPMGLHHAWGRAYKDIYQRYHAMKGKKLTNMRASGSDDAIQLIPPREKTLEFALEFIEDDELVEITPQNIRIRKFHLNEQERKVISKKK